MFLRNVPIWLLLIVFFSSCNVYRYRMFKTEEEIVKAADAVEKKHELNYRIAKNDYIEVRVFTNEGEETEEMEEMYDTVGKTTETATVDIEYCDGGTTECEK